MFSIGYGAPIVVILLSVIVSYIFVMSPTGGLFKNKIIEIIPDSFLLRDFISWIYLFIISDCARIIINSKRLFSKYYWTYIIHVFIYSWCNGKQWLGIYFKCHQSSRGMSAGFKVCEESVVRESKRLLWEYTASA